MLRSVLAVAAGGVIGTAARFALDRAIPHRLDEFPLSTLLINVGGALALGVLVGWLWRRGVADWVRAGLGAGVLGSFTTFSALAASTVASTVAGNVGLALLTLFLSLVLGLAAAAIGLRLGARIAVTGDVAPEDWADE